MPRDGNGRAIIPEARNDENLIIVQFHKAVAKFHNRDRRLRASAGHPSRMGVRDRAPADPVALPVGRDPRLPAALRRRRARRSERHRVPGGRREAAGDHPQLLQAHQQGRPAVHAGRVRRRGLSVRPHASSGPSTSSTRRRWTAAASRSSARTAGFNLNGGRPIPSDLVMEWKNILPVDPNFAARQPRKIDTKLSMPLTSLPGSVVPPPDPTVHLAVRNTLRGKHVGLPSGQQVAKAMRVTVLSNATLGLSNDPGMGRRGAAVVLHPQGGRAAAVQRRAARAGGRQDRRRGPRRAPAAGPELVPVSRPGLEARPTDRADDRPVHIRRPAEVRGRCLASAAKRVSGSPTTTGEAQDMGRPPTRQLAVAALICLLLGGVGGLLAASLVRAPSSDARFIPPREPAHTIALRDRTVTRRRSPSRAGRWSS